MLATVGFAPSVVTLVVLSNQAIHAGASGYGALQATTTVGLAVGAALGGRLAQRFPRVTVMALGYIAMGAGTLLLGLAPSLAFGVLWVAIRSACNGVLSVAGVSVIQQLAPNQYRGRVLALIRTAYEIPRLLLLPLAGGLIQVQTPVRSEIAVVSSRATAWRSFGTGPRVALDGPQYEVQYRTVSAF